jgi:hypothetical protein
MTYELTNAKVIFDEKIVEIKYKSQSVISESDAEEIVDIIAKNFPDESIAFGLLNDISEMKEMTRQARDFFAKSARINTYNALVINKFLHSVLVKMYNVFSKPINETQIFEN